MSDDESLNLTKAETEALLRTLKAANEVEESLGLPKAFLFQISREDDWSFVLKANAVIEGALEQAVQKACFSVKAGWRARDEVKFETFVRNLSLVGRTSKVALAQAYGVLVEEDAKFVTTLAEVRNRYAHRPSNFRKSIRQMLGPGREGRAKLDKLLRVGVHFGPDESENDKMLRACVALNACSVLWSIQFNSSPRSSVASVLLGLDGTNATPPAAPTPALEPSRR